MYQLGRRWKNGLLFAGGLMLFVAVLEGGARLLSSGERGIGATVLPIAFVPAEGGGAASPAPAEANGGDLHSIHLPDGWVWWKVKPDLRDYHVVIGWAAEHDFLLSTDAKGFRRTGGETPAGARRILVVGDSTAFGVGVDDAATWPAQLEGMLSARLGSPVDVVNAGVPGYSSFQAVRMAEKYGLDAETDLLIVCAGFNDTAPTPAGELPDLERAAKNEREQQAGQPASAFLALLSRAVEGAARLAPAEQRPRLAKEEYRETLSATEKHLGERKVPVLWVRWPTEDEVKTGQPSGAGYPDVLLEHATKGETHCVDLMPPFKAAGETPFYDFVHANASGNKLAAEVIGAHLAGMGW